VPTVKIAGAEFFRRRRPQFPAYYSVTENAV